MRASYVAQVGLELIALPPQAPGQLAGATVAPLFIYFLKMGFHHVGQAGLDLLNS